MSVFKKLALQHGVAVVRETDTETGETRVVAKATTAIEPTAHPRAKQATWRSYARKLTNNGEDLLQVLYNLAMGQVEQVKLPDGRVSEPIIPTPEVRRACAVDLLDRMHGKAVAQTEALRATQEAQDLEQYEAMSDEQLAAALEGTKWAHATKKRELLSGVTDSGTSSDE